MCYIFRKKDRVAFFSVLKFNAAALKVIGNESDKKIAVEFIKTIRNNITIDSGCRREIGATEGFGLRDCTFMTCKHKEATAIVMERSEINSNNQEEFLVIRL